MTWSLASLLLLLAALAAGAAWWERGRPPSRLLALVAALAALAALGRLAFAPIPNVKPTTDIVLLSGYVLGGAPGFVVGAVGALASNVVFGQGSWTPWQMAGWGAVGVLGAWLGTLTGRRLGRVPLAAACGIAGLVFGAIMDLSTWATLSGSHTVAAYVTIAGVSLPFNIAHALGNVAFCLLFGPILVAALQRSARRSHVVWRPAGAVVPVLLVTAVLAGAASAPEPAVAGSGSAARGVDYLRGAQNRDGGFGGARGEASTPLYAAWAGMGLAAAGETCGGPLTRYLQRTGATVRGVGDVERTVLALYACGAGARVGNRDLLADLRRAQRGDGSFAGLVNQTAFAVLALRAAGISRSSASLSRAVSWMVKRQHADGGFAFTASGGRSDIDVTSSVLQAMVAVRGRDSGTAGRRAASFLRRQQRPDGGFPLAVGGASNAQSTAFAVQGLLASGVRAGSIRRAGSRTATAYLQSLMTADGSVRYSRTSAQAPVWVTAQVIPALAGRPLPILSD
ncbi:MAG: energy-coupling factor transport system substrate-specific component [Solirubrobacteraceae bacterium]|nr:energy-coupling factor transport system substrate-specific component [Solirubrobacteraceae bacterium]